jgi:hypothetical protein
MRDDRERLLDMLEAIQKSNMLMTRRSPRAEMN